MEAPLDNFKKDEKKDAPKRELVHIDNRKNLPALADSETYQKWRNKKLLTFSKTSLALAAAQEKRTDILRRILKTGTKDNERKLILHFMNKVYNSDALEQLAAAGADLEVPDNEKNRPISYAIINSNLAAIKTLIAAGVDINAANEAGVTPLMEATVKNDPIMVGTLLDAGADINAVKEDGQSALIVAVNAHAADAINVLIAKKAKLDIQDNTGKTALIHAAMQDRYEMVRTLVATNARLDIRDKETYMTALQWAYKKGMSGNADLLKEAEDKHEQKAEKERILTPVNYWAVLNTDEHDLVIQTVYEPETKTSIKRIFDFNAGVLLTKVTCEDGSPTMAQQNFKDLKPEFLQQAEKKAEDAKAGRDLNKREGSPKLI